MRTAARLSPASTSAKPKSAAENARLVSSAIVTVLSVPVGSTLSGPTRSVPVPSASPFWPSSMIVSPAAGGSSFPSGEFPSRANTGPWSSEIEAPLDPPKSPPDPAGSRSETENVFPGPAATLSPFESRAETSTSRAISISPIRKVGTFSAPPTTRICEPSDWTSSRSSPSSRISSMLAVSASLTLLSLSGTTSVISGGVGAPGNTSSCPDAMSACASSRPVSKCSASALSCWVSVMSRPRSSFMTRLLIAGSRAPTPASLIPLR